MFGERESEWYTTTALPRHASEYARCIGRILSSGIESSSDERWTHVGVSRCKCSEVNFYSGEKAEISEKWREEFIDNLEEKEQLKMVTEDGLNTLEYKVLERKELHKIVELIKVEI